MSLTSDARARTHTRIHLHRKEAGQDEEECLTRSRLTYVVPSQGPVYECATSYCCFLLVLQDHGQLLAKDNTGKDYYNKQGTLGC